MNLINPIGRQASSNVNKGGQILPSACMCSTQTGFAGGKYEGGNDNCWHCGCRCKTNTTSAGNRNKARVTMTRSADFE